MNAEPAGRRKARATSPDRAATTVPLDKLLLAEAEALGVDVPAACEAGLAAETVAVRKRKWQAENREAIESTNAHVREHGLPLAKYRQF